MRGTVPELTRLRSGTTSTIVPAPATSARAIAGTAASRSTRSLIRLSVLETSNRGLTQPGPSRPLALAVVSAQPPGDGRPVAVIGAALDLGQGRRGVDMGPSAIRYAGLAAKVEELGRGYLRLGQRRGRGRRGRARARTSARSTCPEIKRTCERIARARRARAQRGPAARARAATTPSRSGRWAGWRASTDPEACSGSTRTATSTPRRRLRAGTCTGWCSPPRSVDAGPRVRG